MRRTWRNPRVGGDTKEAEHLKQRAWDTADQRWREDRVREQRCAGLERAFQHRAAQSPGAPLTSRAPLNVPLSPPPQTRGLALDVQVCGSACRGDKGLRWSLPPSRPEDSQGTPSSPQTSYFGPIPNTSSWFMAGEPEACRLTIKGENQAGTENRPRLSAALPSHARLLGDPARGRWPGLCPCRVTTPPPQASKDWRTQPPLCAEEQRPTHCHTRR